MPQSRALDQPDSSKAEVCAKCAQQLRVITHLESRLADCELALAQLRDLSACRRNTVTESRTGKMRQSF